MNKKQTVAIVGGTGPQGRGLALRLARSGHTVILGSRDAGRAREVAAELGTRIDAHVEVLGDENVAAVRRAELVILAIPYNGHDELVASLAEAADDKIVISCVNPLSFDKAGPFGQHLPEGSAAETAARLLPGSRMVGAFHHLSAVTLDGEEPLEDDVMICGDHAEARRTVCELAESVTGRPGVEVGPLRLARYLEPLTAVLISLNRLHKTHAGLRVTGLTAAEPGQVFAS